MAISPITIATQGVLNSPLAVAAVRGHLTLGVIPPIDPLNLPGGGGSHVQGTWKHPFVVAEERRMRLIREDDEILAIIMAAMRYLQ
jgi:hypothetical protein